MIKPIVTDRRFLTQESIAYPTSKNCDYCKDLLDTAESLRGKCVGLAAPQIGVHVRVIVVMISGEFILMINPLYIYKKGKLKGGKEGCLSRPFTIKNQVNVKRYYKIKISYIDNNGETIIKVFKEFDARVIQHEIDHLNGILI